MLKYDHTFNNDVNYPYHIHSIESNTSSISVNLNNVHIGYFKPTKGTTTSFDKYITPIDILGLMVTGSRQAYDSKTYDSFFKDSTSKYIKNTSGYFLVRNENGTYSWSLTSRSVFFFNPEYFNSKVLWEMTLGYVPTGVITNELLSDEEARALFTPKNYITDTHWSEEQIIEDVAPLVLEHFSNLSSGTLTTVTVDYFIDELQDLKDGDTIIIDNGSETIELTVANCYTSATYVTYLETTRPIAHVDVDIVNPNKKYVYSQALTIDEIKNVSTTIDNNLVEFTVKRIAEVI